MILSCCFEFPRLVSEMFRDWVPTIDCLMMCEIGYLLVCIDKTFCHNLKQHGRHCDLIKRNELDVADIFSPFFSPFSETDFYVYTHKHIIQ